MKKTGVTVFLLLLTVLSVSCVLLGCNDLPVITMETTLDGRRMIILPDGRRFISENYNNPLNNRISWGCKPIGEKNGKDAAIGRTRNGGYIYETEETFCLYCFVPDGASSLFFEEGFVFPNLKADKFEKVVLWSNTGNIRLEDEACIQAILDRLLTDKYVTSGDDIIIEKEGSKMAYFYSNQHSNLFFTVSIYPDKPLKKYYIKDFPNWIDCTDIVEQYLSEYFE